MQIHSVKLLLENKSSSMRKIRMMRIVEFLDSLDNSDKIVFDKEKNIIIIEYDVQTISDEHLDANNITNNENNNYEVEEAKDDLSAAQIILRRLNNRVFLYKNRLFLKYNN
jgi:hypothetical protein